MKIGNTLIEIWEDTQTLRVTLPDGRQVHAVPHDTEDYRSRAKDHGYGDDIWNFCVDHEVGHVLLSYLAFTVSPTLTGVADKEDGTGGYWPNWWAEEAAVLSFQRFAKFT